MDLPLISRLPVEYGPPSISINGPDGAYSVYDLQRQIGPRIRSNCIWQFMDTLSWQHGTHFFKFGTEIDRRNVTFGQARAPRGAFGFTGIYTGSALADFMLGYVLNGQHQSDPHQLPTCAIGPSLTSSRTTGKSPSGLPVNLGLRYDYFAPYTQSDNQIRRRLPERLHDRQHRHAAEFTLRPRPAAAQPEGFRPALRLRLSPVSGRRVGDPRGLRHLLDVGDFERHFRYGGRRPGHVRRQRHRQSHGPAEHPFQQSVLQRDLGTAVRCPSPSATIRTSGTPTSSSGT